MCHKQPPDVIVAAKFKGLIIEPDDLTPANMTMLHKKATFQAQVEQDFFNLPAFLYCHKYKACQRCF